MPAASALLRQSDGVPDAGLPFVPPAERVKAEKKVIAGGPRRVPPASHAEWVVRRSALRDLISWGFG